MKYKEKDIEIRYSYDAVNINTIFPAVDYKEKIFDFPSLRIKRISTIIKVVFESIKKSLNFKQNCYEINYKGESIIIDPGGHPKMLVDCLDLNKRNLKVFLTHSHIDHMHSLPYIIEETRSTIAFIHKLEKEYGEAIHTLSYIENTSVFNEKEPNLNDNIEIIHTPGHTPGSVCFYIKDKDNKILFTGDSLLPYNSKRKEGFIAKFIDPFGDVEKLKASVISILDDVEKFPDDTIIFPGHDSEFFLGEIREHIGALDEMLKKASLNFSR